MRLPWTVDGAVYFGESLSKFEAHPFTRLFDILSGMPQ